ncbi:MAG: CDF family Co(II)/Ni(II) efflux transporter DmeF [Candidatus Marinimicrobia bacterium]|nr:CDF family Co(II)/Ni(II) efflux transporter DmeF [Candidatus Neomarinimicrobiota bacterium]MCF7904446.1 CDF family Co(II)/Ni(II) efflux transporter DmeF [Candidatus Neomarinimicrobiota bacterium]
MKNRHHDHAFGQDKRRPGESRTIVVIVITALTMLVEIVAGIKYGSMALLADGLHMASHAVALSVTAFAYAYARRNATNRRFSFGTGKVNALGGFTGAILLAIFALYMGIESVVRLLNPVDIVFNQAILVAVLGLVVNGVSVLILGVEDHDHNHEHSAHHHDHNLKSAYLHVMADALTSVLAIVALLTAKYFGSIWMDPIMGIVGAGLVARWSIGLLSSTSSILLDQQASETVLNSIKNELEDGDATEITDLHVWSIGPEIYAAEISIVSSDPASPGAYKGRIPKDLGIVHISVETNKRSGL